MRIQKYLSEKKILSRRKTEEYMEQGLIKVNGVVVKDLGRQIEPGRDSVEIVGGIQKSTTIVVNKPRGITSSKSKSEGKSVFDLFGEFKTLSTLGRLDKESEGLLILSDDGALANIITSDKHIVEKEYMVETQEKMTETKMVALRNGMMLEDGLTLPAKATLMSAHRFSIILKEGRNHQIRRMASHLKLTVTKLKRVRVGPFKLGSLPVGGFRKIKQEDIDAFKKNFS